MGSDQPITVDRIEHTDRINERPFKRSDNKHLRTDRAQITIDYLIAITIFLFAVFFVFQYTSGLFTPFQSDSDEVTLVADRVATSITEIELASGDINTPNLVDQNNTDTLFYSLTYDYEDTVSGMGLRGGFQSYELNITMANSTSLMYIAGKPLPTTGNIGQTRRVVLLEDIDSGKRENAILSVRVW
ncbi:DUF7287 family protein [Methanococcoides seepicolus]|uniref:DUF7287 family protein n=1 Tax=Methanococcoides seepicolus TaxID=2828780 RepID=UPI0020322289|nr:hypothetical protein [Methanococcoides seepicolus]